LIDFFFIFFLLQSSSVFYYIVNYIFLLDLKRHIFLSLSLSLSLPLARALAFSLLSLSFSLFLSLSFENLYADDFQVYISYSKFREKKRIDIYMFSLYLHKIHNIYICYSKCRKKEEQNYVENFFSFFKKLDDFQVCIFYSKFLNKRRKKKKLCLKLVFFCLS